MTMPVNPASFPHKSFHFRHAILAMAVAACIAGCSKEPLVAGNEFMQKGEYTSAVIEFKNALQANPDSQEARLALGDAMERSYDPVGAEHHLRKALAAGGDADVLVPRIALMMLDRNELANIIKEFKDLRLKSPESDSNVRAVVAAAFLGQKQHALAEAQLEKANAKPPAVALVRAQLLLDQGKKEQAVAILSGALAEPNAPWWVLRGLGRIYQSVGKREEAFQFLTRAYEAAPWNRGVMGEYGEFLVRDGKLDQAIAVKDKLRKLAPNFYWTHYLDALIFSAQGRSEESHTAALKVLSVAPEHLPSTLLVASAELQKGDVMMADRRLKKLAPQYPYSLPLLQLLAESQLRMGKSVEASEAISRGLSIAPNNPRLLSLRADGEVMRGATKEALATIEQLRASDPQNAIYLLRLSELKLRAGEREEARKLLDQAVETGKDNPVIRDRIVGLSLTMGDIQRVSQLAEYAVKSRPQDPQSYLLLAAALGAQKDGAGALRATLSALDLQPTFQPALTALGSMAKDSKQREELMSRYQKAVQAKPTSAQTYLEYARLLQETKQDRSVISAVLEKGMVALPTATALREALAQELFRAGKPDTALTVAQAGAAVSNAPPDALALLAATYERTGNSQMAIETYRKLAHDYPQRADWRLKLAEMEAASGRKKEAVSVLRALITDRPFDAQPYLVLANLTWRDNLPEALSIARQLGEKEVNKFTAMLLEGDLFVLAGKSDEALKQFDIAAKAGATPAAQLRIVQVLDRTNRKPSAQQELDNVLRKFPADPAVLGFAAHRIRAEGNSVKAAELLQKVADKTPNDPILLNDLAWIQMEAKQPNAALKNASRAAELAPNSAGILDTLGLAQAQTGAQTEAIATLRTAVNLAPRTPVIKLHLAEAYLAAGNRKEMKELIRSIDRGALDSGDLATLTRLTKEMDN